MRSGSLFWGTVLILLGGVLLLDNLNLLGGVNVWGLIWPLALILFGVQALVSVRRGPRALEMEEQEVALEGAQRARLHLQFGAGRLTLAPGAAPGSLLQGSFSGGVSARTKKTADALDVALRFPAGRLPPFFAPWHWGAGARIAWDVRLSDEVPLELKLETGASETDLDLGSLQVTSLRLNTGASSTVVKLPERAGVTVVDADAGAASIVFHVPEDVAGRIRVRGALAGVEIDSERFPRQGEVYQSPGYEDADNRVEIEIDIGAGSVKVI